MPGPPPRLVPTIVLAALWVALYLLYLSVKPDPPAPPSEREGRVTTTTSSAAPRTPGPVTSAGRGKEELSLRAAPARAPDPAG